ncbi:MAG: hypothetical protein WC133_01075 [Candidatus Omnitrophota bacterium]
MAAEKKNAFWGRWRKTKTFKRLRTLEREIQKNPQFKQELKVLRSKFPPQLDPKLKKWPQRGLSYSVEWEKFCAKWKIDQDAFLFQNYKVKANPPVTIKGSLLPEGKTKLRIEIDESKSPLTFTGQEYRDFEPLFLQAKAELIGKAKSRAGRPNNEKRDISIKRGFKSLKKKIGFYPAAAKLAQQKHDGVILSPGRIKNIASQKH